MPTTTTPLLLTQESNPAFIVEQATADVPEITKSILKDTGAWDAVAGCMSECWLMGEPISVLTAIARSKAWTAIEPVALARDVIKLPLDEIRTLELVVEGCMSVAA